MQTNETEDANMVATLSRIQSIAASIEDIERRLQNELAKVGDSELMLLRNVDNTLAQFRDSIYGIELTKKTVNLQLVGLDGNAYSLMGAFSHQARREGWSKEEIEVVMKDCMSGDYDHLLQVLMAVCEPTDEEDGE